MSEPAFDELLRRLAEADVDFVLVGGLALNAWGVVRGTKDVDVVIATDPDNVKRVADVAVAWSRASTAYPAMTSCGPAPPRQTFSASRSPSAPSRI